jgi:hypothetical protein
MALLSIAGNKTLVFVEQVSSSSLTFSLNQSFFWMDEKIIILREKSEGKSFEF